MITDSNLQLSSGHRQDQAMKLFEGKRGPQPVSAHSAPDRLYGEIGRLKMELDWLKKKSGISPP